MLQNLSRFLVGQNGLLDQHASYFSLGETDSELVKSNGVSVAYGEKQTSLATRRFSPDRLVGRRAGTLGDP
jgi:hypothetical protein